MSKWRGSSLVQYRHTAPGSISRKRNVAADASIAFARAVCANDRQCAMLAVGKTQESNFSGTEPGGSDQIRTGNAPVGSCFCSR